MEGLQQLSERISVIRNSITSEEATKTSMIMPFFQLLGYDIFNPLEFIPEYTADFGDKKKDKVDYAIIIDNKPLIFVECKACNENLDKHCPQLIRYFNSTVETKFAILTNGIIYNFYTDLENKNVMDKTPFLSVNLLNLNDRDIAEISKFKRDTLNVDNIVSSAEELKYSRLIRERIEIEMENPSSKFIRSIISGIYDGVITQKVIEQFRPIVKKSLKQYMNDTFNATIQGALNKGESENEPMDQKEIAPVRQIETTLLELEAFGIIKSILRQSVDSSRVTYRDTLNYFGILLDDNSRKWICRLYLDFSKKYIIISDNDKNGVRYDIESIDDIYRYSDEIISSCEKYI